MEFVALKEAFYDRRIVKEGEKVTTTVNLAKLYPSTYKAIGGSTVARTVAAAKTSDDKEEKPVVANDSNDKPEEPVVA